LCILEFHNIVSGVQLSKGGGKTDVTAQEVGNRFTGCHGGIAFFAKTSKVIILSRQKEEEATLWILRKIRCVSLWTSGIVLLSLSITRVLRVKAAIERVFRSHLRRRRIYF
jgi:hypothetical protein